MFLTHHDDWKLGELLTKHVDKLESASCAAESVASGNNAHTTLAYNLSSQVPNINFPNIKEAFAKKGMDLEELAKLDNFPTGRLKILRTINISVDHPVAHSLFSKWKMEGNNATYLQNRRGYTFEEVRLTGTPEDIESTFLSILHPKEYSTFQITHWHTS